MTREEKQKAIDAVERLNALKQFIGYDKDSEIVKATQESLDMAIKAIEQTEPEKCGDCISRETARNALLNKGQHSKRYKLGETWELNLMEIEETLGELPSVEPERKTGKWIRAIDPDVNAWTGGHTCSECRRACVQMSMNYCANCGAPMEVDNG